MTEGIVNLEWDLNRPGTHAQFAELIGVSRQAVGDMVGRGVLQQGDTLRQWTQAYCSHMRSIASGRGSDSELARQRAELTRINAERAQIKLSMESGESAPIEVLAAVLAYVGRNIAGHLEPLPGAIHKLCPEITPEALKQVQRAVSAACDVAASASLGMLDQDDESSATTAECPTTDEGEDGQ